MRLGVGQQYELAAVADNDLRWGGSRNSAVPNYVYRWTEREMVKTLAAYDPARPPSVRASYDLRVPGEATARLRRGPRAWAGWVATPVARAVLRVWPAQANAVAFTIDRGAPGARLHPWLAAGADGVAPDPSWFGTPR